MLAVRCLIIACACCVFNSSAVAQRFRSAPASGPGVVSKVIWNEDGKSVEFSSDGKRYKFDLTTSKRSEIESKKGDKIPVAPPTSPRGRRGLSSASGNTGKYIGRPSRGRQYTAVESPNGKWEAQYKDWNLVLENKETKDVVNVTTDGDENIHYGTASWVYGEELGQTKAMWWTPDSKKILYYKFNDTDVDQFYLLRGWSKINTELYPEYYAKAGAKNPIAELFIYDLETKASTRVEALVSRS